MLYQLAGAVGALQISNRALFFAALIGVEDVILTSTPPGRTETPMRQPTVSLPELELIPFTGPIGNELRPMFDRMWMASGWSAGSPSFEGGKWAGYDENGGA
jgi:hypothetical protein